MLINVSIATTENKNLIKKVDGGQKLNKISHGRDSHAVHYCLCSGKTGRCSPTPKIFITSTL